MKNNEEFIIMKIKTIAATILTAFSPFTAYSMDEDLRSIQRSHTPVYASEGASYQPYSQSFASEPYSHQPQSYPYGSEPF